MTHDPALDLLLERRVRATPAQLWRAWTDPAHLQVWFAPKPWTVARAIVDPRPGGEFTVVMASPEGEAMDGPPGCVLVAEPERRLVWTDAAGPGFRPNAESFMTADITMQPVAGGTLTAPSSCTSRTRIGANTRRWASSKAGARALISSKPWRKDCDRHVPLAHAGRVVHRARAGRPST